MKRRIKFNKTGDMKYISHLDFLRFIERHLKRVKIDVKYSQGFHPRPKLSFNHPIPLGVEAYDEMFDVELAENFSITNDKMLKLLNVGLEESSGIKFTNVEEVEKNRKLVDEYTIMKFNIYEKSSVSNKKNLTENVNSGINKSDDILNNIDTIYSIKKIVSLLKQEEIIVEKVKRGKLKKNNIKEKVVSFSDVVVSSSMDGLNEYCIQLELKGISPNPFLKLVDVSLADVRVEKLGYRKEV